MEIILAIAREGNCEKEMMNLLAVFFNCLKNMTKVVFITFTK